MKKSIPRTIRVVVRKPRKKKNKVYRCKFYETDYGDPSAFGEFSSMCRCPSTTRRECGCGYIYAQQFCPFYLKGKYAGSWEITDIEEEAANKFANIFRRYNEATGSN